MHEPSESPYPRPAIGWYAVAVLTVAYVFSFIDRSILTLLVGPIRADLEISDTQLSLLHGFAFAIFYTTLGIPIALLADRLNRRNIIAIGTAFWSAATAACGLANSFWQLFWARVGVGVGEAALSPAAYSMIADLFAPQRLGRALAVYTVGAFAGAGLAYLIGGAVVTLVSSADAMTLPLVGSVRPWQVVFFIVGLPGLLVALWVLTLPEPARRHLRAAPAPGIAGSLAAFGRYMRSQWQTYAAHLAGFSLLGIVFNATLAWTPAYLIRVFEMTPGRAGFWLGLILLLAGSIGVLAGGWLADRMRTHGHVDSTMRVGVLGALGALPFAATATIVPSFPLFLVLYTLMILFVTMPYGAAAAAIQIVTPPQMRAVASSIYLCCLNLVGLGAGPTFVALFTDYVFGRDAAV
ncbi:MAG TPA: MFS transporter, partial [Steroidobacteraceae bacterium]|nr:MFS transporter [Steroidobacteraceae bacterium]